MGDRKTDEVETRKLFGLITTLSKGEKQNTYKEVELTIITKGQTHEHTGKIFIERGDHLYFLTGERYSANLKINGEWKITTQKPICITASLGGGDGETNYEARIRVLKESLLERSADSE